MPYDRILELMSPAGAPQLYVLGAYAKRVTIYSQQARAINLIDAIQQYRCRLNKLRVAIVGGGIAGVTAAARALEYAAEVSIFEQTRRFISIQSKADHRWVHPHLYEWPYEQRELRDDAGLPVLDWTARNAEDLSSALLDAWRRVVERHDRPAHEHLSTVVHTIEPDAGGYRLHWNHVTNAAAPGTGIFDVVILAMGYGLEPNTVGRNSYWRPDGVDWIGQPGHQGVLVAGYGDGALTDLMRLCLVNFDHEKTLKEIIAALQPSDIETIRSLEADIRPDEADDLTERYSGIKLLPKIEAILRGKLNTLRKIVLTGPGPSLFDPGASTLNRFVVSQLQRMDAFRHIPLPQETRIEKADDKDPAIANILSQTGGWLRSFDEIVLRFGTRRLLPSDASQPLVAALDGRPFVAGLPGSLHTLRDEWAKMNPQEDPTRRPLWKLVWPILGKSVALESHPPLAANLARYCLTVQAAGERGKGNWLPPLVATAVKVLRKDEPGDLRFDPIPIALAADDCTSSEDALAYTTRLLCQAPIAVFDLGASMGQENPTGMLLLGIRAAVRRGLTLVIVDRNDAEPDWDALPFNIKELLVLPIKRGEEDLLQSVLSTGLRAGTRTYRDLPVFDAVRQHKRRTHGAEPGRVEIFALCPFGRGYLKDTWPMLRTRLRGLGAEGGESFDVKNVTEYLSPMLVGERLYELARHAERCMADWTEWRANVFFELGVRLAVQAPKPICIIKSGQEDAPKRSSALLQTFRPIPYDLEDERSAAARNFDAAFRKAGRESTGRVNQVYSAAERHASIDQETGFISLEEELMQQVKAMIGADLVRAAGLTFLYHRNPSLSRQMWYNSVDRLEAARWLLDSKIGAKQANDDGRRQLEKLRDDVVTMLNDLRQFGLERGYHRHGEIAR